MHRLQTRIRTLLHYTSPHIRSSVRCVPKSWLKKSPVFASMQAASSSSSSSSSDRKMSLPGRGVEKRDENNPYKVWDDEGAAGRKGSFWTCAGLNLLHVAKGHSVAFGPAQFTSSPSEATGSGAAAGDSVAAGTGAEEASSLFSPHNQHAQHIFYELWRTRFMGNDRRIELSAHKCNTVKK